MTHPRNPQPDLVNDTMAHSHPAQSPPPSKDIPKGEFIDVASNEPVDPARLQVFRMPQQFLDWVLASDPPHLDPDDLKDTAPHGLQVNRNKLATQVNLPEPPTDPSQDTTATIRVRRPTSLLSQWALTGKAPKRIKIVFAAIFAALILILAWKHLETGKGLPGAADESSALQVATVPLIDAPVAAIPAATSMNAPAQVSTETNRPSAASAASERIGTLMRHSADSSAGNQSKPPGTNVQPGKMSLAKPVAAERSARGTANTIPLESPNNTSAKKAWFPEE